MWIESELDLSPNVPFNGILKGFSANKTVFNNFPYWLKYLEKSQIPIPISSTVFLAIVICQ